MDQDGGKPKIGVKLLVALLVSFVLTWVVLLWFVRTSLDGTVAQL